MPNLPNCIISLCYTICRDTSHKGEKKMIEADTRRDSMLSPQDIAQELNVSPETVHNWLIKKRLKGYKFAGVWRVKPGDYRAFLDQHCNRLDLSPEEQRCYAFLQSMSPWTIRAGEYIPVMLAHQLNPNLLYKLISIGVVRAIWMGDTTIQLVTLEAGQGS